MNTLTDIQRLLKQTLTSHDSAYLYGSRARGEAQRNSDWDILIILDKERLTPADYDHVSYPLTAYGWETDQRISPILYTRTEWQRQSFTPFYKNVDRDKISLL